VWEEQNTEAVRVTLARSTPYEPVRRVLSSRGWMLLLVRYDWKDCSSEGYTPPASVVYKLTRELHRRVTHLETIRHADEDRVPTDVWVMVTGEVQGLQGALGIALGAAVAGGNADELAQAHYRAWVVEHGSEWNRCRCSQCMAVLASEGGR
jgi:hypothetical protein